MADEETEGRSSGSGERHQKLKSLDCFNQVHKMLASGVSTSRVAERIQGHHGEYTDVEQKSLERTLRRYRNDEIGPAEEVAHSAPEHFEEELEEFGEGIDVLDELQSLYRIQMSRVKMVLEREAEMEMTLDDSRREIEMAADLLERIGEFQQDFGIEDRHLGTLELEATATNKVEEAVGESMQSIGDPSKRNQLAEFLQTLDSADDEVIEAAIEESEGDGPDRITVESDEGGGDDGG